MSFCQCVFVLSEPPPFFPKLFEIGSVRRFHTSSVDREILPYPKIDSVFFVLIRRSVSINFVLGVNI